MSASERGSFSSSFGVIVAMAGSAVGLGNMWRFPYLVGENGGAAFILIYLLFVLVFCLPVMLCEFVIGRRGGANAVKSFALLAPKSAWPLAGVLGILAAIFIMAFYPVIGGWGVNYLVKALNFTFSRAGEIDYGALFNSSVSSTVPPLIYMAIFLLASVAVVAFGVKNGIEKCSKVMMPVLFFLVLGIAIYAMCLPGAGDGIRYLFRPDFSAVTGKTVAAAMGQAFFSLSLGMGAVITYASYAGKNTSILRESIATVSADTVFAIIAGCAIMPAVFAFGYSPEQGPGLVFVTLPALFADMPGGGIIAILFFIAFLLAAITSAISLLEVMVAYFSERLKISRGWTLAILTVFLLGLCTLSSLANGPLADRKIFGMDLMTFFDYTSANFMMTLGALLIVLFVGWKIGKTVYVDELTNGGKIRVPRWLLDGTFFVIKYIAPPVIVAIVLVSILG
jgi:NSS family neurotransmitter:Na+ symporter